MFIAVRYATRSCVIASDTLVLGVTWTKTFNQWYNARELRMATITTCLLRDGKLFAII